MGKWLPCFKAYDVRGKVPSELNVEIAYGIGRAFADETGARVVCVGHDIRLSGPDLCRALIKGLNDAGVHTVDLGLIGTEMVYFATAYYNFDGGIMITASHNPSEYNGMKIVRKGSKPISSESGLYEIERRAFEKKWERSGCGQNESKNIYPDFKAHLLKLTDVSALKPLKILANAGNGAAGLAMQAISSVLPYEITPMYYEPDGHFPHGVPNPILEESRMSTLQQLRKGKYDFGVAWDGDYDRCFFFDEHGRFIEGYYIVGLLSQAILSKNPGEKIIYDPRLTWNTIEIVEQSGGIPVICKSGHAFIKEKMRSENAIYGGEMSAHHYFRDHWYCDSGLIPLLWVGELLSQTGKSLGELVDERIKKYPCSGELNLVVTDSSQVFKEVESKYAQGDMSRVDGLSIEFSEWRFNLRSSNTEPVIRLNVETRGNTELLQEKVQELLSIIRE